MSTHRSNPRRDVIMSKLLDHVSGELRRKGVTPDAAILDAARKLLDQRWEAGGSLGGNDVTKVVAELTTSKRAQSSLGGAVPLADPSTAAGRGANTSSSTAAPLAPAAQANLSSSTPQPSASPSGALQPLVTTSKRQRRILADDEWARAAEADRRAAAVGRKEDRHSHLKHLFHQRSLLDEQLDEHHRQQEADRRERQRLQDEMTRTIEANREATRREQQEAHDRACKEKEFRERQHREHEEAREQARIAEHNEQVRQALLAQQELQRQRDLDNARKLQELEDWKRTLRENEDRMHDKKRTKEEERAEGRRYMKQYADQLDQQERDRADARARKAARAEFFRQLADGVASQYKAKSDNHDAKIEAEYQQQLSATLADEAARKERNRKREEDTHATLRHQMQVKKEEQEREREDARRRAQAMREQEELAKRQEELRRQAQRAEATRLNEFLNTQLQLLHYKETRPLETSITRPLSRAKTMFSPTRYRPSTNSPSVAA